MPDITPNLGLKKPLGNETVSRAAYNENLDLIDQNAVPADVVAAHLADKTPHIVPMASVYNSAAQSIANNVDTALVFDTELIDNDGMHDNVTNPGRITVKTAGKYIGVAYVAFATNGTGIRRGNIRKNGGVNLGAIAINPISVTNTQFTVVTPVTDMAVNDYIELVILQDSGGSLDVLNTTKLSLMKVG